MANFYAKYTGIFGGGGGGGPTLTWMQEVLVGTFAAGNTTYTLSQTPNQALGLFFTLGTNPQAQVTNYTLSGATVTFVGVDTSASTGIATYQY